MPNFVEPAWDAPLDGGTYLRAVPLHATIKGMYPAALLAEARARGVTLASAGERFLPFLDYPLVQHMRMTLEAAPQLWPDVPLRQALRKMGRAAAAAFRTTTTGKAMLAGLGSPDTVLLAMRALGRAYAVSHSKPTPTIEVTEESDSSCVLRMSDLWTFLDSQHVGIIEGLCRWCGVKAEVRIWTEGLTSGQFHVRWSAGPPPST